MNYKELMPVRKMHIAFRLVKMISTCKLIENVKISNIMFSFEISSEVKRQPQDKFTRDILTHNISIKRYCNKKILR